MTAPAKFSHRCIGCGREHAHALSPFCPCGHFIDIVYDLSRATLHASSNPYERFFDLLPVRNRASLPAAAHPATPCPRAAALGRRLGLDRLYLKDETVLPTGSTKDRMAIAALSYFRETGVRRFCAASTGNTSTAFAHWVEQWPDLEVVLFCAEDFLDRLQVRPGNRRVKVYALRDASFVEACDAARQFAEENGLLGERGFFNPARREGLKLAYLEATDAIPTPIDWYVQAVSSAMGVYGTWKGARELMALKKIERLPRPLCVQQESNRPMVASYEAGSPTLRPQDVVKRPHGIAKAILRGDPSRVYPYMRSIVQETGGTLVSVPEQEIRDARAIVEDLEGISICFNAAAAVAGLIRCARDGRVGPRDTVMVNLTGRDREPIPPAQVTWLRRGARGWEAEAVSQGQEHAR